MTTLRSINWIKIQNCTSDLTPLADEIEEIKKEVRDVAYFPENVDVNNGILHGCADKLEKIIQAINEVQYELDQARAP